MRMRVERLRELVVDALNLEEEIPRLTERLDELKSTISDSCFVCRKPAGIENFCFGCNSFVCQGCFPIEEYLRLPQGHTKRHHKRGGHR